MIPSLTNEARYSYRIVSSPAGRESKSILIHCTSLRTERPMPVAADSSSGGGYGTDRALGDFAASRPTLLSDWARPADDGADRSSPMRSSSLYEGRGSP